MLGRITVKKIEAVLRIGNEDAPNFQMKSLRHVWTNRTNIQWTVFRLCIPACRAPPVQECPQECDNCNYPI